MSRLSLTPMLTCAAFLSLLAGCDRAATPTAQEQGELPGAKASLAGMVDRSNAGDLMPAVTVRDPDGKELNLGALQGTPVLINLWATWCAPCVVEMPLLEELAAEREGKLRVITISQDMQGAEKVVPFFAEREFALLEPWMDEANELGFAFEAGLPITVLYDEAGREVWRMAGAYEWNSAEAAGLIDEGTAAR